MRQQKFNILPPTAPLQFHIFVQSTLALRKVKNILPGLLLTTSLLLTISLFAQDQKDTRPFPKPAFQVDVKDPTADKPQCKLWYMRDAWWALMPRSTGPSLWQRTANGWIERKEILTALPGVPGRADVSADEQGATCVGVDPGFLTVFRLKQKNGDAAAPWTAKVLTTLRPPVPADDIETATITRDDTGRWWVASDAGDKICVWSGSADGKSWSKPLILAKGIGKDDICTVSNIKGGVMIIWSDQVLEKVSARFHKNGNPVENWDKEVIIDAGNKTADDHLHATLSNDGTLWVATKNSVDTQQSPQQVMRVRSSKGVWKNFPYANLDGVRQPSRPVVLATEDPNIVLAGHTIYHATNHDLGEIVFGVVDTTQADLLRNETLMMAPDIKGARINNITTPRKPYRMDIPWIVLASDNDGRVFEADLRSLVQITK